MPPNYVTPDTLRATSYALIAITTIITAVRLSPQLMRPKTIQWDDGFLIAAYIFFLVVAILYLVITDIMFKLQDVGDGKIPPYESMMEEGFIMQKVFFVVTSALWFNLWCVKYSLLAFYKRLIAGLKTYTVIWTVIVVFCFVVFCPIFYAFDQVIPYCKSLESTHVRQHLTIHRCWLEQSLHQWCLVQA